MFISWWDLLILVIIFTLLFRLYAFWEAGYYERRGIKNLPFDFPIIGNMYKVLTNQEHFIDAAKKVYTAFPDEKYVGFKQLNNPHIMIRDLEMIKKITIKDFDHFLDHSVVIDEHADPLFGLNLFSLKGDKWKDMRATLSPAFTSSKMRTMFVLIDEIGKRMTEFYEIKMKSQECKERGLIEVEMKDAYSRYTNDVIASTAFGLDVNSLDSRDNEFYKMGKKSSDFSGIVQLKFFLCSAFPYIAKYTGITVFHESVRAFFRSIVSNTMKHREASGIVRPDMIQLLMEAKKGSLKYEASINEENDAGFATVQESNVGKQIVKRQWTDAEIIAQALLFFIAGFEGSSTLLSWISYELALNPDVQKKLQEEIDESIATNRNVLDYNILMKMKYMDMVVSETLRRWPPAISMDRNCNRSYTLPPPNDLSKVGYTMQPGEGILIPVYAIHHDPQYYPNPEKFDPERFSDENKLNINPLAFIPFGVGPRNCIGSRFALMEAKVALFHLMSKFDIVTTAKTQIPIKISYKTFNLHSKEGTWLGLKPRNK